MDSALRAEPVATSVTFTWAPGTIAPVGSVTAPLMAPVPPVCALRRGQAVNSANTRNAATTQRIGNTVSLRACCTCWEKRICFFLFESGLFEFGLFESRRRMRLANGRKNNAQCDRFLADILMSFTDTRASKETSEPARNCAGTHRQSSQLAWRAAAVVRHRDLSVTVYIAPVEPEVWATTSRHSNPRGCPHSHAACKQFLQ